MGVLRALPSSSCKGLGGPLGPQQPFGPPIALRAVLGAFGFWFLKISKVYFESELPLLGGVFYKTFLFEASAYMFLVFENFEIVFSITIPTFGDQTLIPNIADSIGTVRRGGRDHSLLILLFLLQYPTFSSGRVYKKILPKLVQ